MQKIVLNVVPDFGATDEPASEGRQLRRVSMAAPQSSDFLSADPQHKLEEVGAWMFPARWASSLKIAFASSLALAGSGHLSKGLDMDARGCTERPDVSNCMVGKRSSPDLRMHERCQSRSLAWIAQRILRMAKALPPTPYATSTCKSKRSSI